MAPIVFSPPPPHLRHTPRHQAQSVRTAKKLLERRLVGLAFGILYSISATAQTTVPASESVDSVSRTYKAQAITVSARRELRQAAVTRTTVDSTVFTQENAGSLADLLGRHSPLFVKSYGLGSAATVSFRGTAASHTQVEWNGLNINNPMMGQVDFSLLPVWFVDRAELLHGGSSLQEGSGALGGSVQLGSLPQWDKKLYGSVMQGFGSFGTYQTYASLGGGGKKFHARVRYFWEQADNDFPFLNTAVPPFERVRQQNAAYRKQGALGDFYWNAGRGNYLTLNVWHHHANRDLPPIMSYEGAGRTENERDDELRAALKWSKYDPKYKSELVAGISATAMDYLLQNTTDLGTLTNIDSRSTVQSYSAKYRFEYNFSENTLLKILANGAYHTVRADNRATREGYDADRTEIGLSASVHQRFNETFSGYLLIREELTSRRQAATGNRMRFTPFMPSLGLEAAPFRRNRDIRFRLNATRNYHQPTLNDLYWIPGGNPDLQPEQGYTFDIAAEYETAIGRWSLSTGLTGYSSWIDDWIIWRPGEYRYWTAENIKKVFARGLEATLRVNYLLPAGLRIGLSGNYAYTRTTNEAPESAYDNSGGQQLIYIPVNKASAMLDLHWRGYWLNYQWSYTGERFTNSSNEPLRFNLPGYSLHDLAFGAGVSLWRLRGELSFRINNLFNKDYQAILWRAMPGRNYNLQLRISF